jgi:hypothetical protein
MRINSCPEIDINILVQGQQISEYGDNREGDNNEAIAHIKCQSNARFTINFLVQERSDFETLGFFIYIDNQPVTKFGLDHGGKVEVLGGIILEKGIVMPKEFKFSNERGKIYVFSCNDPIMKLFSGSIAVEVWVVKDEKDEEGGPTEDEELIEQNNIWKLLKVGESE